MIGVFAFYGSLLDPALRRRLGVEPLLRRLRPCEIRGRLFDLGPYPGLVPGPGRVRGELFAALDSAAVELLDQFEECDCDPPLFVRRRARLIEPSLEAWVYFYDRPVAQRRRLRAGRWFLRALR